MLLLLSLLACKEDLDYQSCEVADDCAEWVPEEATSVCLEKSGGGFCSWECATDTDCEGDVEEDYTYVCASFESTDGLYCFPSCNEDEADSSPSVCPEGFGCRSTGGGNDNRRICFPNE